jgi:uncharacterized protein (DUF2267 family)
MHQRLPAGASGDLRTPVGVFLCWPQLIKEKEMVEQRRELGLGRRTPVSEPAFLQMIETQEQYPSQVSPADAAAAVLCVLTERLSVQEARKIFKFMPKSLLMMFAPCALHEERQAPFDRDEFFRRLCDHLQIDAEQADGTVLAVFAALQSQLPDREIQAIANQLPSDLEVLWSSATARAARLSPEMPAERAVEIEAVEFDPDHPVVKQVEHSGALPPNVDSVTAITAVMCILAQRLSKGEATDLQAVLPPPLDAAIQPCAWHRAERGIRFDRVAFLDRLAAHLEISPTEAERITAEVFAAVRQTIPASAMQKASEQLPQDLKGLWLGQ